MQTECLVAGTAESVLDVKVRFLQMTAREGTVWNEAVDRAVPSRNLRLGGLHQEQLFDFDNDIQGAIETAAVAVRDGLFRVTVRIANRNPLAEGSRETILLRSLVSTHTILGIRDGEFISLLDPPEVYRHEAAQCRNLGTWPVLAGEEGTKDTLLSSPIILYDYPQIAPESGGDYYDGTEMDEMLALRVLTLTDEEKREMRTGDERARRILERTETMPDDHMLKLHGAVRGMRPVEEEQAAPESIRIFGVDVKKGDRVRLWPKKGGDIFDMALEGMVAIIDTVEQDFEDRVHLAVVLEDDPGRDLGALKQPGHRFFFSPEEVEPLALESRL
ncbi:MAG: hypothetical protein M3Z23_12965, partial [Acidobacteriota bacterium]|nr:hypothetical protein [Acidobacteriota bacterium]